MKKQFRVMMNKRSRKHKYDWKITKCKWVWTTGFRNYSLNVFIYDFLHDRQVFLKSAISLMTFDFLSNIFICISLAVEFPAGRRKRILFAFVQASIRLAQMEKVVTIKKWKILELSGVCALCSRVSVKLSLSHWSVTAHYFKLPINRERYTCVQICMLPKTYDCF